MEIETLTKQILDVFPDVTFKTDTKRGNIRVHFKAEEHNFVPSKWMFCNALNLPENRVHVAVKRFNHGVGDSQGKLFTISGGLYL